MTTQKRSARSTVRWLTFPVVVLVVLAAHLGAGVAQGGKKKRQPPSGPPADLPEHVYYLARQLLGVPLDESANVVGQIQKLIVDHMAQWMADRTPSDVEARRELESVFSKLRYPLFGEPAVSAQPWNGSVIVAAGYTLGWSDYDRVNVVALFVSRDGKSHLAALTNFVARTDLHYQFLPAKSSTDFRFFAYGKRLGKSHPRLSAILYAFDGQSLITQWEQRDVYEGKLDMAGDRLTLRYLIEDEFIRAQQEGRLPPRHEAVYQVVPRGLTLLTDHEIPY